MTPNYTIHQPPFTHPFVQNTTNAVGAQCIYCPWSVKTVYSPSDGTLDGWCGLDRGLPETPIPPLGIFGDIYFLKLYYIRISNP